MNCWKFNPPPPSIRSRGEIDNDSDKLLSFHEAVAEVVEMEERFVEDHRSAVQLEHEMLAEEEKLLAEVDGTDFDVEDYVKRLEQILVTKMEKLQVLQGLRGGGGEIVGISKYSLSFLKPTSRCSATSWRWRRTRAEPWSAKSSRRGIVFDFWFFQPLFDRLVLMMMMMTGVVLCVSLPHPLPNGLLQLCAAALQSVAVPALLHGGHGPQQHLAQGQPAQLAQTAQRAGRHPRGR